MSLSGSMAARKDPRQVRKANSAGFLIISQVSGHLVRPEPS